jgi:thiamine-phosphate pyrophosphorylase
MRRVKQDKIFRVIDANFNRAKEGLRVCEDITRFVLDQKGNTKKYKAIRHALTQACSLVLKERCLSSRSIEADVGKQTTVLELKRKTVKDIFYANSQRVKESVRVLEEFFKLIDSKQVLALKKIRYQVYALERKVFEQLLRG